VGGIDGAHIRYLSKFFNTCVEPSLRHGVPASLYDQLAQLQNHWLAMALLQTAWLCPSEKVVEKECQFVTGSDIAALARSDSVDGGQRTKAAGLLCHGFRKALRASLGGNPCDWPNDVIRPLAIHDNDIGRYVLNKMVGTRRFEQLQDIAEAFARTFSVILSDPQANKVVSEAEILTHLHIDEGKSSRSSASSDAAQKAAKAKARAAVAKAAAKQPKVTVGLYELGDAGECTSALGMLRAKGWEVGSVLLLSEKQKDCNLEDVFHISSVDGSRVALRTTGGQSDVTLLIEVAALLGMAAQVPSDRVVMHSSWPGCRISKSKAFAEAAVRSRVMIALETLTMRTCSELETLVDIKVKPFREVIAKKDLGIGQVVLVPETPVVKILEVSTLKASLEQGETYNEKVYPLEVFLTGLPDAFQATRVFLGKAAASEAVCPYWCLEHAKTTEEANLVEVLYSVQVHSYADPWTQQGPPAQALGVGAATPALAQQAWAPLAHGFREAAAVTGTALAPLGGTATVSPGSKALRVSNKSPPGCNSGVGAGSNQGALSPALAAHQALMHKVQQHDGQGEIVERFVYIPVLVNTLPVKKGEALRMLPAKDKAKAKAKSISVSQVLKKARLM